MMIANLIESMIPEANGEFTSMTVLMPLDTATAVRDLAHKMGVPTSRLHAELLRAALTEAEVEWRRISMQNQNTPESPDAKSVHLDWSMP